MADTIKLRIYADGFTDVEVDHDEYEAAKAAGEVDQMLDTYVSDLDTDVAIEEPDGTVVTLPEGNVLPPPVPVFLIWSLQHLSWWKPKANGYTGDLWAAGRFTASEAMREPTEDSLIVPAPESGRSGSFDVGELGRMRALMEERIDAVKAGIAAAGVTR